MMEFNVIQGYYIASIEASLEAKCSRAAEMHLGVDFWAESHKGEPQPLEKCDFQAFFPPKQRK